MATLEGQIALVTGASRGIGRAIALELGRAGAKVVVNYAISEGAAREVVEQLQHMGREAFAIRANVRYLAEVRAMVQEILERWGRVDILVNNAGINRDVTLRKMTPEQWVEVIETNLNSVFWCTSAVLPGMLERKYGRIINIGSVIGQMGNIGQANYAATKAGMIGFTKSAALEFARSGITVNCVCPGFIETDMVANMPEEARQRTLARIPMQRFGTAEEVAKVVRFLAEEGDYISGQTININGALYVQ
jgi:acetoacetyl-CoA reductase